MENPAGGDFGAVREHPRGVQIRGTDWAETCHEAVLALTLSLFSALRRGVPLAIGG